MDTGAERLSCARAPEFLFENVGSRGDIAPLIAVAAELVRRGYRCANQYFETEARRQGIGFCATTSQRTNSTEPQARLAYMFRVFEGVRNYFATPAAFDAHTMLVNTDVWGSSEPFAEALQLRTVRLHLFPIRIRSLLSPAWPLGARACGPERETFLKVTLPAMYRAADTHPEVLAKLNEVRARVGLDAVRSATYERPHVVAEAALFPDWYAPPAGDWPEMECMGFPLPASTEPLPERLLGFLARFPRPLVFTPGTSVGQPQRFFDAAIECCAELGMPGIFLSPFLKPDRRKLGESIEHFEHIELDALLRHAALLVHHGGMGTTARALQAAIPQVISPFGFDQFDNGHRVEVLGAGNVVPRDRWSGTNLAAAVRALLSDSAVTSRLAGYRVAIAQTRAIERCADLLERVSRNAPLHRQSSRSN
jgi:rhamnosyltransferase subunit B